ncbi:MAG: murein biosynthesis integral membrane protein MurJ, partial [Betaproteobacteria bacterium TMED156]
MNLFKTTASISFFTLISRFTGLIREILIASYFGVSEQTDAFFVAFRIPNLLRRLFAEGAFSQAFVPVLGEIKSKEGDQKAKSLAIKVGVVLSIILVIVTLLCIILSPFIVWLMTGGFNNNQKYELTVQLTQWMFPYIFFISLVALSSGVLNTFSKFRIPAVTPVLLNLSFIFCTLFLTPYLKLPIWSLAVAVLLGGIAQLIVQFWALKKIGLFQNIQFSWFNPYKKITEIAKDQNIQKILTLMLPASMAVSVAQLSLIINTNIASRLEPGSVSWLSYADRIMELPTALLGVALGTVLLPTLTKSWNENDNKNISKLLDWGLKLVAFFCIPCSMIMAIMSEPIGAVIFHYGEFSNKDLMMSSQAISAYSIGIFGLVAIKILAPGYYSQQDIKTPVKIALITLLITQILNVFLVPIFAHVGLALAIGIAAFFNALMLLIILIHRKVYRPKMDWIRFLVAIFISSLAISIFCYSTSKTINWIELQSQPFVRLFYFLIII